MEAIAYILLGILLTVAVVWGRTRFLAFAAQKPEDYDGVGPAFEMREHLNGPILCEGVIYGPRAGSARGSWPTWTPSGPEIPA
jgi:hypothetical protein